MKGNITLKSKIIDFWAMTRWKYCVDFNIVLSFAGPILINAVKGSQIIDGRILIIVMANFISLIFTFAINDVEDSEEDATDPKKKKRNPIAAGRISKSEGYMYLIFLFIINSLLYSILWIFSGNYWVLVAGILSMIVGFFYSYRRVRFKNLPVLDLISHSYMFAGGQFVVGLLSYVQLQDTSKYLFSEYSILAFIILSFLSIYGQLENQRKDYDVDYKTQVRTTTVILGQKYAKILQILSAVIGIVSVLLLVTKGYININWIVQLILTLVVFMIYPITRNIINKDKELFIADLNRTIVVAAMINIILLGFGIVL